MRIVRAGNLGLAFLLELALLAALVAFGVRLDAPWPVQTVVAVVLPVAVVLCWGVLVAPRARRRLTPRARLVLETVLLGVGVVALAVVDLVALAIVLAVLAAVNLVLRVLFDQV